MTSNVACSGCNATYAPGANPALPPSRVGASFECWGAFSHLLGLFYSPDTGLFPYRQWVVDAYMVQHPKLTERAGVQSVALSLGTLQLSLTAPSTVSRGAKIYQLMALQGADYPVNLRRGAQSPLNVKALLNISDEHELFARAHEWAKAARAEWAESLPDIDAWLKRHNYFQPA